MTDTEQPYTPGLDEVKDQWRDTWHPRNNEASDASFDRMIAAHDQAVRDEEREKAARIAENTPPSQGRDFEGYPRWGSYPNLEIAERIRAQGKERDRG